MKIKTSDLTGLALDWAVTKAIGEYRPIAVPSYSADWGLAGPIIEREKIAVDYSESGNEWCACAYYHDTAAYSANNPLTAAMRCYVASKLGNEVDVPEELAGVGAGCV